MNWNTEFWLTDGGGGYANDWDFRGINPKVCPWSGKELTSCCEAQGIISIQLFEITREHPMKKRMCIYMYE